MLACNILFTCWQGGFLIPTVSVISTKVEMIIIVTSRKYSFSAGDLAHEGMGFL